MSDTPTSSGRTDPNPASSKVVAVGDGVKAPPSFRDSARQKLDADYAKALADGTRVVVDTTYGGRHLDVSGLSDRELAAVAKGQGFTKGESETAKAELAGRLKEVLEPFSNSPADTARAIKSLYPAIPQDVKDAMGWNQSMLEMGDRVINAEGVPPKTDKKVKSIFDRILEGQNSPHALKVDTSLIQVKGGSVNLTG